MISLILIELILFQYERIPFTSSYRPGRRPLIETLVKYGVTALLFLSGLSALINVSARTPVSSLVLLAILITSWLGLSRVRLRIRHIERLEFSDPEDKAVQLLEIERD